MPLAQISEPWPTMELVQLEQEVPGGQGVGGLGWVVVEGVEIMSNHFLVAVCSHPGVQNQCKVVRGFDSQLPPPRVGRFTSKLYTCCLT